MGPELNATDLRGVPGVAQLEHTQTHGPVGDVREAVGDRHCSGLPVLELDRTDVSRLLGIGHVQHAQPGLLSQHQEMPVWRPRRGQLHHTAVCDDRRQQRRCPRLRDIHDLNGAPVGGNVHTILGGGEAHGTIG